jgi:transposase
MLILGGDTHKRSHTSSPLMRPANSWPQHTTSAAHVSGLGWAQQQTNKRLWAIEDCRHLSRRLERDLLLAGERIVRVSPKLMAHVRDSPRTYGKSDPIDVLAVAGAALREPDLPVARLEGPDREVRLLVSDQRKEQFQNDQFHEWPASLMPPRDRHPTRRSSNGAPLFVGSEPLGLDRSRSVRF